MPEIFLDSKSVSHTLLEFFFCPSSGALLAARGGVAQSHTSSMLLRAAGISGFVLHPESGQKSRAAKKNDPGKKGVSGKNMIRAKKAGVQEIIPAIKNFSCISCISRFPKNPVAAGA